MFKHIVPLGWWMRYRLSTLRMVIQRTNKKAVKRIPKFGCAKGTFKMADDFDEPLDDFKDYMP